jgi:hypothetical protein
MMARIMTTIQKKNTMMPGMAYPATVLALATATSYPRTPDLFGWFYRGDDAGPKPIRGRASHPDGW